MEFNHSGKERRNHPRHTVDLVAEIQRDEAGKWLRHGVVTSWRNGETPASVALFENGVRVEFETFASPLAPQPGAPSPKPSP